MAHLEVEPKPPRPWWPWALLIIVIIIVMVWLYNIYNKNAKSHLRAINVTEKQSIDQSISFT
jgi:hypothetical protein